MFTEKALKDYLTGMLAASKIEYPNIGHVLDVAIPMGIAEFWGLHTWNDRMKTGSLSITSTADAYDLPSDFDSIVDAKENDTTVGLKLRRLIKEDFDKQFPKLSYNGTGNPRFYSIYKDNGVWKVTFAPRPESGMTIYFKYHKTAPNSLSMLPSKLNACCVAFIFKNCLPLLNANRATAHQQALSELELAKNSDKESSADMTEMPTEDVGVYGVKGDAPWLEGWG